MPTKKINQTNKKVQKTGKNFWQKLKRPIITLAPMYDVTDSAFRQIIAGFGRPSVFFTEFVSADGLVSEAGRTKLLRELYFTSQERPIVAQIFGANPTTIKKAVKIIRDLGFDGIDINMGCPDRAVNKIGAGAALIKTPKLAQEIIKVAKQSAGTMPVSVKIRIGWGKPDKIEFTNWFKTILKAKPAAITIHFRTRNEMSKPPARWSEFALLAVELAKTSGIPIIGNGDAVSIKQAGELAKQYGLDGVMIGRGIFGQPWLFADRKKEPNLKFRLRTMIKHAKLFEKMYGLGNFNNKIFNGHTKNFSVMKKHFKAYVIGFAGASTLRNKLMLSENSREVEEIIKNYLKQSSPASK